MFTDSVHLRLSAGKGGNGAVAWRREKYIPKGGPAGGDGGTGGSIYIEATTNLFSLEDFRNTTLVRAANGVPGGSKDLKGRNGADITLKVPCGTLVKDAKTGDILYDLTLDGEKHLLCQGGIGGKGNAFFKSSTNRAPTKFTEGRLGEELEVELELKLIADIGLVGMPNAGKSTFISKVSKVPVKIAPYPFTTLRPNLGIVEFDDYSKILIADIPGIIKDAHNDRGLGLEFLKHIERTKVLIYVIDVSGVEHESPYEDYLMLKSELEEYNSNLVNRPYLILLNKTDVEGSQEKVQDFLEKYDGDKEEIFSISAKEEDNFAAIKAKMKELTLSALDANDPTDLDAQPTDEIDVDSFLHDLLLQATPR